MNKILIVKDAAEKALAAEGRRTESLLREAGKLVFGILIVTGFQLMDIKTLLESTSSWVKIAGGVTLAVLAVSLFFALIALRVKDYADYPRGNKLWETLKPDTVSEDAAEEALVHMLLATREQNAKLNDAKARALSRCGWLFFIGVLLAAGSQFFDAYVDTLI